MKFCKCSSEMQRDFVDGRQIFICRYCNSTTPATPEDARIAHKELEQDKGMFSLIINNSPFVRENQRVRRQCKGCPLDYMTLTRVSESENITYTCKCGMKEEVQSSTMSMS